MRDNVKIFVKCCSNVFAPPEPILEVGAFQVDGQIGYADLRTFFPGKRYIGVDVREGSGVDQVENVEQLSLSDGTVGSVIIVDTLEHVENPHKALDEIHRVVRNDGMVIMASPQNFPIHDYPRDFWRFTPEGFGFLLRGFPTKIIGAQGYLMNPHTVFGVGSKREIDEEMFDTFIVHLSRELSKKSPTKASMLNTFKGMIRPTYLEELSFDLHRNSICVKSIRARLRS